MKRNETKRESRKLYVCAQFVLLLCNPVRMTRVSLSNLSNYQKLIGVYVYINGAPKKMS